MSGSGHQQVRGSSAAASQGVYLMYTMSTRYRTAPLFYIGYTAIAAGCVCTHRTGGKQYSGLLVCWLHLPPSSWCASHLLCVGGCVVHASVRECVCGRGGVTCAYMAHHESVCMCHVCVKWGNLDQDQGDSGNPISVWFGCTLTGVRYD